MAHVNNFAKSVSYISSHQAKNNMVVERYLLSLILAELDKLSKSNFSSV